MSAFCTACSAPLPAGAKFCGQCGAPVQPAQPADWAGSITFADVAHQPAVTRMVEQVAGSQKSALSGEAFMKGVFKVANMTGSTGPVPLELVANVGQSFWAKAGIKASKTTAFNLPAAPGRAIAATLCAYAARGYPLSGADQAQDGCILRAKLPASLSTLGGEVSCAIRPAGKESAVEAAVNVPGQAFDWGRGQRTLDQLRADLPVYASRFA